MENKNVKLIDKQVYEEDGLLYLSLTYEFENIEGNNEGKYNLYIPKIALDIKTNDMPIINHNSYHYINHEENVYDFKAGTHNIAPNYIGKKAYVNSLKPNTKFKYKGCEWLYDGEYVSTENFDIGIYSPWWNDGVKHSDVRMKVTDKMLFEINDNLIVDDDTKFE